MESKELAENKSGLNLTKVERLGNFESHYFKIYTKSGKYIGSIIWQGRYTYCGRNMGKMGIVPNRLKDILTAINILNIEKGVFSALVF